MARNRVEEWGFERMCEVCGDECDSTAVLVTAGLARIVCIGPHESKLDPCDDSEDVGGAD